MICTPAGDRRRSSREERHRALVEAARALAVEHGAHGFTIDRVAAAAGVSRRTVFNHFAGLDHLLVAVCEEMLTEVTSDLLHALDRHLAAAPPGGVGRVDALDLVCEVTRGVDLPTAIVTISRAVGGPQDDRADGISRTAFDHVVGRLRERLDDHAPELDPLDLELTLALLANGIAHVARRWLDDHPELMTGTATVPAPARSAWDALLDRLLDRLRTGYAG